MTKSEERNYKEVCSEMTDKLLALASEVSARAVTKKVAYRLACHAIKVAVYQGLFGAVLRGMKNDNLAPSDLKMEKAFIDSKDHELVAYEIVKLIFDHLQVVDPRHIWSINVAKRERRSTDV